MNLVYIKTVKGAILFIVQYSCLVYLLLSGPVFPAGWYLQIIYAGGLFLGVWSIMAMRFSRLNAGPDPLPGLTLVDRGPYRVIRHPMYAAILMVFIPLVINDPLIPRIIVLCTLVVNLLIKLLYEEKKLDQSLESYQDYSGRTWRLIPLVY